LNAQIDQFLDGFPQALGRAVSPLFHFDEWRTVNQTATHHVDSLFHPHERGACSIEVRFQPERFL
jgi:hypothetical protein